MVLAIAIINFIVSITRFYFTVKNGRLIAVVWFLIAYFSWFFIPVIMGGEFVHFRGFIAETITISEATISFAIMYVFAFNLIFLGSEFMFWMMLGVKRSDRNYILPARSMFFVKLQAVLVLMLILGTVLYGITTYTQGYRDYVEYKGSSWGMVFLWASSSLASLLALQKKYVLAIVASLPFVYFAIHLNIRSFALLTLIPVVIVYLLQITTGAKDQFMKRLKKIMFLGLLASSLLILSTTILAFKSGALKGGHVLPDSGMPFGTVILFQLIDKYDVSTKWDSLTLYGQNLINPFLKLFSIERSDIVDPPVVMAQLYDAVPVSWDVYFHYPTLWYTDAYIAFGLYGLLLPILWAIIFVIWERIMIKNTLLMGLLLPFYTWYGYMLVRGAIATATVPFSYAAYFVFIAAFLTGGFKIFKGSKYRA